MKTKLKNNAVFLIIVILFTIIILNISNKILMQEELVIDKLAYNILVEKLRDPSLTIFMKFITQFSDISFLVFSALLLIAFFSLIEKNRKIACLIPVNLILITIVNQTLKLIFQRDRPIGYRLIEMDGFSFPSGHAMVSMAFYGLLIYIISKLVKKKPLKIILIIINIAIIVLIGISRVYLGVHYLSDVVTGYSISIIYLLLLIKLLEHHHFFP